MKSGSFKDVMVLLASVLSAGAVWAAPQLSDVAAEVVARSGAVKITYTLSEDAIITLDDVLVDGVSIGASNVTKVVGACHRKIKAGAGKAIYWFPKKEAAHLNVSGTITAKVTAYDLATPPDYMLFELRAYQNAGNWTYSTEFTCTNLAYATRFYSSVATLPDGGLKNIKEYYNRYVLMRKVPAKDVIWRMGYRSLTPSIEHGGASQKTNAAPHYVKLTSDYYMSVYPMTYGQHATMLPDSNLTTRPRTDHTALAESWTGEQWDDLKWGLPYGGGNTGILDGGTRKTPVNSQMTNLRGSSAFWPQTGHDVAEGCAFDLFRRVLKEPVDLPTEAQWEFAARAGTDCPFGVAGGVANAWPVVNGVTNVMIWCRQTGEKEWDPNNPGNWDRARYYMMPCGLLVPNSWGLYDMNGTAWEHCLDKYHFAWTSESDNWYLNDASTAPRETYNGKTVIVDPVGPADHVSGYATHFCLRGGSGGNGQENGSNNFRYMCKRENANAYRLVCPVPVF